MILLLLPLGMLPSSCQASSQNRQPLARGGVLDLRQHDWSRQPVIALDGEWDFHWNRLLQNREEAPEPTALIPQPGLWSSFESNGQRFPARGFATLDLEILVSPQTPRNLGFFLEGLSSSAELALNGRTLLRVGQPGINRDTTLHQFAAVHRYFESPQELEWNLRFRMANHVDREGGRRRRLLLGTQEALELLWTRELIWEVLLFTVLGVMGFYHLILFSLRRRDRYALSFGLMCILFALRVMFDGGKVLQFLWPGYNFDFYVKFWIIQYYWMPLSVLAFLRDLFPRESVKKPVFLVFFFLSLVFTLFKVLVPLQVSIPTLSYFHLVTLGVVVAVMIVLIRALRAQREGARLFLASTIIIVLTSFNDILHSENVITTMVLSTLGLMGFVMVQVYLIAYRFSRAFHQVEVLSRELKDYNATLEQRVAARTRKVRRQSRRIMESIEYAKLLQNAVLPGGQRLAAALGRHQLVWMPRDGVGGDFYWLREWESGWQVFVGDCTGHGVPGALMVMMVTSQLLTMDHLDPRMTDQFMMELNHRVRSALSKDRKETVADDGLDLAILTLDRVRCELSFTGAKMGLYQSLAAESGRIIHYPGGRQSLGYRKSLEDFQYERNLVPCQEGDRFYLTSDGLLDQNGGEKNYPWGRRNFMQSLESRQGLNLEGQIAALMEDWNNYRGGQDQRDDVCLLAWEMQDEKSRKV